MAFTPDEYRRLKTLEAIVPPARPAFERLISYATAQGYQPYIVSAVRTCSEEHGLSGTKVRRSWHVLGRAVDVELHARGQQPTINDAYTELGTWWEGQGGTWGGRWTALYPVPHPEGWCGPLDMPGDTCHFQFTDGVEAVPESVWPRSVTACADVDGLVASYRAAQGAPPLLPTLSPPPAATLPGGLPAPGGQSPDFVRPSVGPPAAIAVGTLLALVLMSRRRGRA